MRAQRIEILLVEDNENDIELTLHALRKDDIAHKIQVVRDGAEALDYLQAKGSYEGRNADDLPKVVLLDLKLPKINGIEVLRAIRDDPRLHSLPVVALTSSAEEPDIQRCYELGVNSFIVKPVDFKQFSETVRQLGLYWVLLNQSPPVPT